MSECYTESCWVFAKGISSDTETQQYLHCVVDVGQ